MPHANAIHSHIDRLIAHAKLNVITADKERHGETVLFDSLHRNAAIPPGSVSLFNLDVCTFVFEDIRQFANIQIPFYATISTGSRNIRDILELTNRILHRKHGAINKGILIFSLSKRKKVESANQALGHDGDIVIHQDDMGELTWSFGSRHHSTCESSRTACVGVREHGDQIIGKRRSIERLAIVDDKHVEVVANRTVLFRDAGFNKLNVWKNISFILKCGGRKSKIDRVN